MTSSSRYHGPKGKRRYERGDHSSKQGDDAPRTNIHVNVKDRSDFKFHFDRRGKKKRSEKTLHARFRLASFVLVGIATFALILLKQHLVMATLLVSTMTGAIAQHVLRTNPSYHYCEKEGVLVSKDDLGWKASCGFKITAVAQVVHETEYNLEKAIAGFEGVRFRVLISKGIFGKEVENRMVNWYGTKKNSTRYLAPDKAGCSWFLIIERRLRTLAMTREDIKYLIEVHGAVAQGWYQHYKHFQFVPMTGRELVEASIL
ncbi:MAG: hypothetical protein ACFFCS_01740 [Candidatus Hodarchaeota archaeon]